MHDKEKEFQELVFRQQDMLWHLCGSYRLSAAWQTEDALQEVLKALWLAYPRYASRSSERTWVYRVATSTLLMLKRKTSNQPQPDPPLVTDSVVQDDEGYQYLLQLIDLLPDTDAAIVHAHLDGFSHIEIAQMTGLTVPAVASRLSRAKRHLREQYQKGL